MPEVHLLYERTCPNVASARANLMRAFSQAGVPATWNEVDLEAAETPDAWRRFGSPTILVDGEDVVGGSDAEPTDGACCRLYRDDSGVSGAPSVAVIAASLTRIPGLRALGQPSIPSTTPRRSRAASVAAALPGLGLALLPKGLCPACWPAYAAVLSALGLGFLMQDAYLLPLTVVFLALATLALAYRASARRGRGPALLGAASGLALIVGKFALDTPALAYAGVGAFAAAAIWNVWPVRRAACTACPPTLTSPPTHAT